MFIPGMPQSNPMDPYQQQQMPGQDPLAGFEPGGMPANILQQLNPPAPQQMQQPSPEAPPRKRRSFLDTIGQISDVLAKVGGADALYQPSIDGREDRARMVDLDAMKKQQMQQQLTEGENTLGDSARARVGMAMKGLQAIRARGGDISAAWPILAQRAGISEQDAAQLGQVFQSDPNQVDGLAAMFGADKEFGLQPFYAQGKNGTLQAFQIGKDGTIQEIDLPEGTSPIDPLKFVDIGGSQVGVGTRTGTPRRILPKTERPGYSGGQPDRERPGYSGGRPIVAAPAAAGKAGSAPDPTSAMQNIAELRTIYSDLNKMGAMVNPNKSTGSNVVARTRSSVLGQLAEGAVGTQAQTQRDRIASIRPGLVQSIAKATGMSAKQLDSNADVKLWMQTVTDPTSSYQANVAALNGLERFVRTNSAKPTASAAPRNTPQRVKPRASAGAKPSVSNW